MNNAAHENIYTGSVFGNKETVLNENEFIAKIIMKLGKWAHGYQIYSQHKTMKSTTMSSLS